MRAPADAERAASVGHRETFDVDAFATACASALGFDADAVDDAVEILMECAPTLVEKNVVAIDASFVRPRPRASRGTSRDLATDACVIFSRIARNVFRINHFPRDSPSPLR